MKKIVVRKTKPKVDKTQTVWLKPKEWSIRNNTVRKKGQNNGGTHPSLVVGKNKDLLANFGITHEEKRGHHKNIQLSKNPNPKDKKAAYLRTDLEYHNKTHLKEELSGYKLSNEDKLVVIKLINKKK